MKKYLYALVNLSLAGVYTLIRNPTLGLELLLRNSKDFRSLNQIGLKTVSLNDLLPDREIIPLRLFAASGEFTYLYEVIVLGSLARALNCRSIFEIGTYHGYTAAHLVLNTPEEAVVYTLDLPPETAAKELGEREGFWSTDVKAIEHRQEADHVRANGLERRVTCLYGDSRIFDYAPYAGKMDLVFIDGAHSYEYVKSDSENAHAMLSTNGVIVWHDYGETGKGVSVNKAVEEFAGKHANTYQVKDTRLAVYFRQPPAGLSVRA